MITMPMDLILSLLKIPYVFLLQNYWRDEVFRIFISQHGFIDIVKLTINDGQPPLYYFVLKIWMWFFGDSEIATRTLSVVCFEILLFVIYLFAKKIKPKSKTLPFLTVAIALINPSLIYYAFETRIYMFFILPVTLSFYFLFCKKYTLWIIVSVVSLYINNFMVFVIISQILTLLLQKEKPLKIIKMSGIIFLFYLPWLGFFLHQARLVINDFWITPMTLLTFGTMLGGIFSNYDNDPLVFSNYFIAVSVLFVLPLIYGFKARKNTPFFYWLFFVIIGVSLVSLMLKPIYLSRYLSFLTVPLIFLTALYIDSIKKTGIKLILTGFVLLLILNINLKMFPYRFKPDMRKAVTEIAGIYKKNDLIYTTSLNFFETKYYFAKLQEAGYTGDVTIKILTQKCRVPYFVGKVIIKDEDIVCKIPADKRVFNIDSQAGVTVYSRYR